MRRSSAVLVCGFMMLAPALPAEAAPDTCTAAPADSTARAMTVELAPGADGFPHRVFVASKGSELPAVSVDGATIAQLFSDGDVADHLNTTMVFWSKTGKRVASFSLGPFARQHPADKAAAPVWQAYEAKALAETNALLAKTKWRPLAKHWACGDGKLRLDDDTTLGFDAAKQQIVRLTDGKPKALAGRFPGVAKNLDGKPCVTIDRLSAGFGGAQLGIAIVLPGHGVAGEMCHDSPSGETAIAISLH